MSPHISSKISRVHMSIHHLLHPLFPFLSLSLSVGSAFFLASAAREQALRTVLTGGGVEEGGIGGGGVE